MGESTGIKEGSILVHSSRESTVCHGGEVMVAGAIAKWSSYTYVRRQRKMDTSAQLAFSFVFILELQSRGFCHPQPG